MNLEYRQYTYEDLFKVVNKQNNNFNFSIRKYEQGCPVFPGFHWYHTILEVNKIKHSGSGESYSKKIALIRSIGEAIERYLLLDKSSFDWKDIISGQSVKGDIITSSNGMAYGLTYEGALESAYRELVERHVVLNNWLNNLPIFEINGFYGLKLLSSLNAFKNGLKTSFLYFPNEYNLHVVAVITYNEFKPPYFIMGLGSNVNLRMALEKAFMECWRLNWNFTLEPEKETIKWENVKTCADHYRYYASNKIHLSNIFNITGLISFGELKNRKYNLFIDKIIKESKMILTSNLDNLGLVGYVIKVFNDNFMEYWTEGLTKDIGKRKKGEIQPIA